MSGDDEAGRGDSDGRDGPEVGRPELLAFLVAEDGDRPVVARVEAASRVLHLAAGEVLLQAGQPTEDAHLVVEGSVEVRADGLAIEAFQAGQWLLGRPRAGPGIDAVTLSLVAPRPATVILVPQAALSELRLEAPAAWRRLHGLIGQRVPSLFLASTDLFAGTDPALFRDCDDPSNWIRLESGQTLFHQGDPGDALYLIVHGTLEVLRQDGDETARVVATMSRGQVLGEMALLVEGGRSATVRAVRDSVVARVSRLDFERLLTRDPAIGVRVAKVLAARLARHDTRVRSPRSPVHTVAVLASRPLVPDFTAELAQALETCGSAVSVVSSARLASLLGPDLLLPERDGGPSDRLVGWLSTQESQFDILVYDCDDNNTLWTTWAVRQADVVLVVCAEAAGPARQAAESKAVTPDVRARVELVIVHPGAGVPAGTRHWLAARSVAAWHHVRAGMPADYRRLARRLNGTTVGVALSGGGARGFAQIGALRALEECGWEIDYVGGTSMGAVIGAQYALEMSVREMVERSRRAFASAPMRRDLTLPIIALGKGRMSVKVLQSLFGDTRIEDCPVPFFCVSCNLSQASQVIHERGPIWLWARASTAVPGIVPPIPRQRDLLVDGGVLNNLPADVVRQRCNGLVVAIDVSGDTELYLDVPDETAVVSGLSLLGRRLWRRRSGQPSAPGILQILARSTTLSSVHNRAAVQAYADLYLRPPVDTVNPFDFDCIDEVVELGYRSTVAQLQAWEKTRKPTTSGGTFGL